MPTTEIPKVRLKEHGAGEAKLAGLLGCEVDAIQAFMLGITWIRTNQGRLETRNYYEELPQPTEDPHLPVKWTLKEDWSKLAPFLVNPIPRLPDEPTTKSDCPSIIIQHLCGYNNTPYEIEARRLQDFGFECLRSRRGESGRFWELWYLPGLWCAKGELAEYIKLITDERRTMSKVIDFLCRQISFGTLHVCYQRAAMTIE